MAGRPEYYGLGEDIAALKEQVTKLKAALDALDGRTKTLEGKPAPDVTKADLEKLATANTDALAALKKDPSMRGPQGEKGADGKSVTFSSQKAKPTGTGKEGGLVYCTDDGHLYSSDGKQYTDLGQLKGEDGKEGKVGPPLQVEAVDTLPADANAKPGVLYITKDGKLRTWEA